MTGNAPPVVGTFPTTTKPPRSTPSAVLSPGRELLKKVFAVPGGATAESGEKETIVFPLPWMFALSLKLLTSTSPVLIMPPPGKPSGTKATPYGFSSPVAGTVEVLSSRGMNASAANAGAALIAATPIIVATTAYAGRDRP